MNRQEYIAQTGRINHLYLIFGETTSDYNANTERISHDLIFVITRRRGRLTGDVLFSEDTCCLKGVFILSTSSVDN